MPASCRWMKEALRFPSFCWQKVRAGCCGNWKILPFWPLFFLAFSAAIHLFMRTSPIPKRAPFSLNLLSLPFSSSCIAFTLPSLTLLASQPQFAAKVPLGHLRAWDTHPFWIRWILPLKRTIMVNSDLKTCRDVLTKRNRRKWQRLKKNLQNWIGSLGTDNSRLTNGN